MRSVSHRHIAGLALAAVVAGSAWGQVPGISKPRRLLPFAPIPFHNEQGRVVNTEITVFPTNPTVGDAPAGGGGTPVFSPGITARVMAQAATGASGLDPAAAGWTGAILPILGGRGPGLDPAIGAGVPAGIASVPTPGAGLALVVASAALVVRRRRRG